MSVHTAARGQGRGAADSEVRAVLEGFLEYAEVNGLPKNQMDRIRAVLAALSPPCACGGRKVVGEGTGKAAIRFEGLHGKRGYVAPHVTLDTDAVHDGQTLLVLAFADEEGAKE